MVKQVHLEPYHHHGATVQLCSAFANFTCSARFTSCTVCSLKLAQRIRIMSIWQSHIIMFRFHQSVSNIRVLYKRFPTIIKSVFDHHKISKSHLSYCWWTKSCTTKDDNYPIIYRVLTIPGGAGFRPSTVAIEKLQTSSFWISDPPIQKTKTELPA